MNTVIHNKMEKFLIATQGMMLEREEVLRLMILSVFSRENLFLYGPPGTGKSLLDLIQQLIFGDLKHFRFLMREDARYEDVFGEVIEIENKVKKRVIEGKLPTAEIAFLDEIWKGNSGILNSLLTALNEGFFDDLYETIDMPLLSAMSASNEFPARGFLSAIFERFLLRIEIPNVKSRESFEKLINNDLIEISAEKFDKFTWEELNYVKKEKNKIKTSPEYNDLFFAVREQVLTMLNTSEDFGGHSYQISGRTTRGLGNLSRVSALINGRQCLDISDFFLAKYVLWNNLKERKVVYGAIDKFVFGDKDNITGEIDIILAKAQSIIKTYEAHLKREVTFSMKIEEEKKYLKIRTRAQEIHMDMKNIQNEIINKTEFFNKSEEVYQKLNKNVFLFVDNIIPFRAIHLEKIKIIEDIFSEKENKVSEGLYIDIIKNTEETLEREISEMKLFEQETSDYFDYTHSFAHRNSDNAIRGY